MTSAAETARAFADLSGVLRQGRLSELPEAAARIEALLARREDWTAADLAELRRRGAALRRQLEAAARGIRGAQARLADIRAARTAPSTYDGNGKRQGMIQPAQIARRF